jgi:acetyl-CoA carboxylase biotin carboxyl carrier protein
MDLEQLKLILNLVREHELSEFEIEQEGLRLKIRKDAVGVPTVVTHVQTPHPYGAPAAVAPPQPAPPAGGAAGDGSAAGVSAEVDADTELAVVKSPIVGTFYRSPEPGAPPFVDVGTSVKKGQVLCVIEAMKLMNEIDSEYDGDIVNVYVENGQPVQYGERLFAIRAKA